MTLLIISLFVVTALLSIPIAHALVLASVGGLLIIDKVPVHLAIEQMLSQTQSFPLIAIPFFMMTGALMVSGRLGQSLVNLLSMMIGRVHGGPAQVGVMSSTIFGGVSVVLFLPIVWGWLNGYGSDTPPPPFPFP